MAVTPVQKNAVLLFCEHTYMYVTQPEQGITFSAL
jgi:hypothetical protein